VALSVEADLELLIGAQKATLTGSGKTLRLTLESARMLRQLRAVSLPLPAVLGTRTSTLRTLPTLLEREGLTLEIADRRGLLLTLGRGARGKRVNAPGLGTLEHTALAGGRAALRLAFGS
jgi:hypothetical protein